MRFSDTGMVFVEKLCEKARVSKELRQPASFSACARSARQSFVYIFNFSSYTY